MSDIQISDYDKSGYDYTKYWIGRQYEDIVEQKTLEKLLPESGNHILDLGGSFGRFCPIYCPRFEKATILDYSNLALEQAQAKASKLGFDNLETVQGDAYQTPFENNTFDAIMMIRVMHHIEKPETLFQEVHRILQPGGTFILEMANKIHLKALLRAYSNGDWDFRNNVDPVKHTTTQFEEEGLFYNYHPKMILPLLESEGFTVTMKQSVSNLRIPALKKIFATPALVSIDHVIQPLFTQLDLGPSLWLQCQLPQH